MNRLMNKVSVALGMSVRQAQVFLTVFGFVMGSGLILAVLAGTQFYTEFTTPIPSGQGIDVGGSEIERRISVPPVVLLGEVLPDVVSDLGGAVTCNDLLLGDFVLKYGWVWDESELVCRRLRQFEQIGGEADETDEGEVQ